MKEEESEIVAKKLRASDVAPEFHLETCHDNGNYMWEDVRGYARQSLGQRRAGLWGPQCAECKAEVATQTDELIVCTKCRQHRYCSKSCRTKHMSHSFEGCFTPEAFRVSDKHRLRHILTGDHAALELSLGLGSAGMGSYGIGRKPTPRIYLADHVQINLLDLAALTGDTAVVRVLVDRTDVRGLTPSPSLACRLPARQALDSKHIPALVAMMFGRQIEAVPTETLEKCTSLRHLNTTQSFWLLKMTLDQYETKRGKGETYDAYQARTRDSAEMFFQLLLHGLRFEASERIKGDHTGGISTEFMCQALHMMLTYKFDQQEPASFAAFIQCDRKNKKYIPAHSLSRVLTFSPVETLRTLLDNNFLLGETAEPLLGDCHARSDVLQLAVSNLPSWNEGTVHHRHCALLAALAMPETNSVLEPIQTLARNGAWIDLDLIKKYIENPSKYLLQASPVAIERYKKVSKGFGEYLTEVRKRFWDNTKMAGELIDLIMDYLPQREWQHWVDMWIKDGAEARAHMLMNVTDERQVTAAIFGLFGFEFL